MLKIYLTEPPVLAEILKESPGSKQHLPLIAAKESFGSTGNSSKNSVAVVLIVPATLVVQL